MNKMKKAVPGRDGRAPEPAGANFSEVAPALCLVLDREDHVIDVNENGCTMLGAVRARMVGQPLVRWVVAADHGRLRDHLRRCRAEPGPIETEIALRGTRGGIIPVRLHSRCKRQRRDAHVLTVALDLRERAALECARDAAERHRRLADRQRDLARAGEAVKDRLIAIVSHVLRNPLSPALAAAHALESCATMPERVLHLAAIIRRNIQLEARLIDDLMDVARISRGRLQLRIEPTDVHQVLAETLAAVAPAAVARGIEFETRLDATATLIAGDPARLRQVFWNVLDNAIKFSTPPARVEVSTANIGTTVRISIRDHGVGMDAATLHGLFLPFAERRQRPGAHSGVGLGLGLSIVRGIMDAHGGRFAATSPGATFGATFDLEFPALPNTPSEVPAATARDQPPAATALADAENRRVLVVEDDPDTASLIGMFLSDRGYAVSVAHSLHDGLEALASEWDVLISDIGLPDGSGLELARRARAAARPPRTLIALSGYGSKNDVAGSHSAGFDQHLVKPIDLDVLMRVLRRAPHGMT
jgi:PAS domain S-box-containing protein